jgi:uncharacterized protein (TIGR03083 family)
MQLTPRYDGAPPLCVRVPMADPAGSLLHQRRRLIGVLRELDNEQWRSASRCAGWSVRDVVAHLVSTDRFWALSIRSGLDGNPSRVLMGFDPVTTPERLVESMRSLGPDIVLEHFVATVDQLANTVGLIDAASWSNVAEAPPGHIELTAVVMHALWDGWIHERDIVLPLGFAPVEEGDEVAAALVYVAALGPTLLAVGGSTRRGTLAVEADLPMIRFAIDLGEAVVIRPPTVSDAGVPRLCGPAVELIEGLSFRAPLEHALGTHDRWMLGGLAEAFDRSA